MFLNNKIVFFLIIYSNIMTTINSTWWIRYKQIPENVLEKESKLKSGGSDSPGENAYGNSLNDNVVKANFARGSSQGKQSSASLFGNTNAIDNVSGPTLLKPLARPRNKKFGYIKNNRLDLNQLRTPINGI